MDKQKRKELQEQYKEMKTYMGVIQIKNEVNGKIYIDSYSNLKNKWLTLQGQLETGRFANAQLQRDWKQFGSTSFTYVILEQKVTDEVKDMRWELKQIVKPWLEKLQPYEDRGYNKRPAIPR